MTRITVSAEEELASLGSNAEELVSLCASLTALLEETPETDTRQLYFDSLEQKAAAVVDLVATASETAAYMRMRVAELRSA